jgi:hypothetical protein
MTSTKPAGASLSTWKTLFLGGVLGFVLALTFVGREGSVAVSRGDRWLNEEGATGIHSAGTVEHSLDGETEEEEGLDMVCRLVGTQFLRCLTRALNLVFFNDGIDIDHNGYDSNIDRSSADRLDHRF